MPKLAVITPTWKPDRDFFAALHRSFLRFTSADTVHHVIVPWAHKSHFTEFAGPRCRVWTHPELLPRRYVRMPSGVWINTRRPWPPVRGWVMQQAAKIAAAGLVEADAVLLADSDVVFVRQVETGDFSADGRLTLFRKEGAVHAGMERHVIWHRVARELLGLPAAPPPPLNDYVDALVFWEPARVRAMQARISEVTGLPWADAFTSRLHVSEFVVYGVYADELVGAEERPATSPEICHSAYIRMPMDHEDAMAFADRIGPEAIGMMISSHSHTPAEVREAAAQRCAEVAASR